MGVTVFDAALQRLIEQYEQGHRLVVSFSGGKDSTCVLEMAVLAATMTGRLPVEAVMRDEEIMLPGTYEYVERVHARDDVDLHWLVANQPILNAFNRADPYWWVFDPLVAPDDWVRQPPPYFEQIDQINIQAMTTKDRFPIKEDEDQKLMSVIGMRIQESRQRMYGLFSAKGYVIGATKQTGVWGCWPIYDWTDGDVWRAIEQNHWDFNSAYSVMNRHGMSRAKMRIGPPMMNVHGVESQLRLGSHAFPAWWDRVCRRLPGVRTAAAYGKRVLEPERRVGESWQATFQRECIDKAPPWIAERSQKAADQMVPRHSVHSTMPFPEVDACEQCSGNLGSWRSLTRVMYLGDPFSVRATMLPYVEPEFFRPGAGKWNGSPG